MYKPKKKKSGKNKKFQEFLKSKNQQKIKQDGNIFETYTFYKYIVNTCFGIVIFDASYGHWQIGSNTNTVYGGFVMFEDDELIKISDNGSESLNKPSIIYAREKDIEYFRDKIKNFDFNIVKDGKIVSVKSIKE